MEPILHLGKPQFTMDHGSQRHDAIRRLFTSLKLDNAHILEIGSYEGASALLWSELAGGCKLGGSVTCIDTWAPYFSYEQAQANEQYKQIDRDLRDGSVFSRFKHNIKFGHPKAPISYFQGTSQAIYKQNVLTPQFFDIVYVDGSHAYKDVLLDIHTALIYVKDGGIICGDDLEKKYKSEDQEFLEQHKNKDYIHGFHPGVTLAVFHSFGNNIHLDNGVWSCRCRD